MSPLPPAIDQGLCMIVFSLRLTTSPAQRHALVALIEPLLAPTRVEPGCESCRLYADTDDAGALTLVEEWSSQAALDRHLQSEARKSLIAAMELSNQAPVVRFDTIARREGLEVMADLQARSTASLR
ncbi:MAG: putative quinol monooxygenase [Rubrivivax sp.]